jgi:hypothetical protein
VNLELLYCQYNEITSLDLSNNVNLKELVCYHNRLDNVNFLQQLPRPENLTILEMSENNIQTTNLEVFRRFVNLYKLLINNNDEERIDQGIYNRFYGSLEPLKDLTKLETLDISKTDNDNDRKYLPNSLKNYRNINRSPKFILPSEGTKKAYNPQDKETVSNLDLSSRNFPFRELIIEDFPNLRTLNVGNNHLTGLLVKSCPKLARIIASHNQLAYLQVENCDKVREVFASYNCLKELNLSHLKELKTLTYDNDNANLNTKIEVPPKGN